MLEKGEKRKKKTRENEIAAVLNKSVVLMCFSMKATIKNAHLALFVDIW